MAGKTVDLAAIARDALDLQRTDEIFVQNEEIFVEICARWIQSGMESGLKIAAFARVLPLAPHLAEHVERFLTTISQSAFIGSRASGPSGNSLSITSNSEICRDLLGIFRLLSYDCRNFEKHVRVQVLEGLFQHSSQCVRYLAVRAFCVHVHAADHATQELIKRYVGDGEVQGEWEGLVIDYRFLSLWEEKRWSDIKSKIGTSQARDKKPIPPTLNSHLSQDTASIAGVLLPRLTGFASQQSPAQIIDTPTTQSNLSCIASALLTSSPLLLTGLPGSGKTLLVRYCAWQLNKLDSMVTLHLNEQSDAKLLVGMYATGAKPGTFSWRPGVLTTAVREGRWIFIEDLDRAPNEVISTLLPLIERGELLIPSRGETVRAAWGFRIIATMRSSLNPRGQEIVPRQNMIGHRFWNSISVRMPELFEFERIVSSSYPLLEKHVPGIMRVYARLLELYADAKFTSENGTSLRALTPRDLLKWCDRVANLVAQSSSFTTSHIDDIFMEAFDCFAGCLRSDAARAKVMACVAEELHLDPQRRDHILQDHTVQLEFPTKKAGTGILRVGRARISRHNSSKCLTSSRPFSTNDYTRRLLEKIAVAVDRQEPLLLVGETGTGKTTCIQYLAEQLGRKLVAFNLSQQSESGDLLGGYKPVNVRSLVIPLKDEFDDLFDTTFSRKKNQRFLEMLGKRVAKGEWKRLCVLWREALKMVDAARKSQESQTSSPDPNGGQPKKKRKMDSLPSSFPGARWEKFAADLHDLEAQLANGSEAFAFSFLEGNIVKAVRNGDWVLLDEINLASSDTLEAIADLLGGGPDGNPSILLTETGCVERVVAHPNFRVFAAMNPATDVGKKDLPPGIRSRFTELYVESPDSDRKSLQNIVEKYLGGEMVEPGIVKVASDVTKLYLQIQELAKANMLVDGADQKAHFSLRTLTRTLNYAREIASLCSIRRALFEGFHMSFLTFLGKASEDLVAPLIKDILFPQRTILKAELGKTLLQPKDGRHYVRQGHYWLRQGAYPVEEQLHYIITPFVQRNMNNLIRAASTRRYPVLIQGPTSSGKTSMIEYLAKKSGNKFVRINNHEHTDLQEYLGSYISGDDGKLAFQEGILVKALREGHWIVLDELNLAPTDVLEALNRLLDDNRELLIPETQEVVRPHDDFMLFATQNPAGLYGGRKVLSRAFRNRFLELHFDDIPVEELTEILHRRTMIPESWCKRIVSVYQELSTLRQENRIFEQKSFATLRDLFRWAQRKADTIQELANNGYMLLAERVRKEQERVSVKNIIETVMSKNGPRVTINEFDLYNSESCPEMKISMQKTESQAGVVWTSAMRRLFVLVAHAIRNDEPVLLIGETGCGKTTVCQLLSDAFEKQLHILNAHQNTETGDLIGAQRPIRNRAAVEDLLKQQLLSALDTLPGDADLSGLDLSQLLQTYDNLGAAVRESIPCAHREAIQANRVKSAALFEWADGSLVHAMRTGQFFLLDEISLADDSVLERLNSVLESSRTLLLAEKGPKDSLVTATEGFQFLATMNPGGDYGKKELSPALRNRFTEIWVPALSNVDDILQIVRAKLKPSAVSYAEAIVSFSQWFNDKFNTSVTSSISIRDTLAWVTFINRSSNHDTMRALVNGAAMVFIDTLGANPAGLLAISATSILEERRACLHHLSKLTGVDAASLYFSSIDIVSTDQSLLIGEYAIPRYSSSKSDIDFSLEAPTTRSNAMRVARALQLSKPILLEGNPGVGKTTLITALANAIGKPLTRLNLSEQTDLMDLFGSDVPVEGGQAGTFAWRDAPFLKAMRSGDWVLLDEMNLASQSVLEGLNAVLDHRGEVYISELDQTFHKHADFRVFAAQNPHHQGGGRKGLPASFVNRFTVVYADIFLPEDLLLICTKVFPDIDTEEVNRLISFVSELDHQVVNCRAFGALGAPWEFNLRDTLRWLKLRTSTSFSGSSRDFLDAMFAQRFRCESDRQRLFQLFETVYGAHKPRIALYHDLGTTNMQVGFGVLARNSAVTRAGAVSPLRVPQLPPMEALMVSVRQNWPVIVVGPPGSGKTSLVNQLASFTGANVITFAMNADIDAMDLVGGYEQMDPSRERHRLLGKLEEFVRRKLATSTVHLPGLSQLLELLVSDMDIFSSNLPSLLDQIIGEENSQEANDLGQALKNVFQAPKQIDGARFQWVDGILIQALEQGKWLVLDNANLCSSAVLDRLNSLLEPNGYLSINEHPTDDGQAKIVKPHPDFRIFMTMDPRFGELSRAMRNRAVEIFLLPGSDEDPIPTKTPQYPLDSNMYRFRHLCFGEGEVVSAVATQLENLSIADTDLVESFYKQASLGLSPFASTTLINRADLALVQANGIGSHNNDNGVERMNHQSDFLVNTWARYAKDFQHLLSISQTATVIVTPSAPYHPLHNELAVQQNASSMAMSLFYSSLYDVLQDLYNMKQALQILPSARLERRKERQKLPGFLHTFWKSLSKAFETVAKSEVPQEFNSGTITSSKALQQLFWAFYELISASNFDRATFQTYLKMLSSVLDQLDRSANSSMRNLTMALYKEVSTFGSEIQLTSGLGMERIWRYFRPETPRTWKQLTAVLGLESLADRLDIAMWKSKLSLDDMVQLQERLGRSLELVRRQNIDASELIKNLEVAVRHVEDNTGEDDVAIAPYFEEEFEGLCQFLDLATSHGTSSSPSIALVRARTSLLARRPTKSLNTEAIEHPSATFTRLYRYLGLEKSTGQDVVLHGRFHTTLLNKIYGAAEVQLKQLDHFQTELQTLSHQLALDTEHITRDQNDALHIIHRSVLNELCASHQPDIIVNVGMSKLELAREVKISAQYQSCLLSLEQCIRHAQTANSQSWVKLGLNGLALYVPNYPHDPALQPMIEREMFQKERRSLMSKLQELRSFQVGFTGQKTSFRIRQVEDAIKQMGDEPPVPPIVRPADSELDAIHGEFSSILSVIQPLASGSMSVEDASANITLRQNIAHIIRRLHEGYRGYDDITAPAVGFLVCLSVGLALVAKEKEDPTSVSRSLAYLASQTPFYGFTTQKNAPIPEALLETCVEQLAQKNHSVDLRSHALHCLVVTKAVDPSHLNGSGPRQLVHDIFSSLYSDWKKKLLQDQKEEAMNSSLYTFRGDDDEADEEDLSLFPDYEQEAGVSPVASSTSRDHTVRLADTHSQIFNLAPSAPDAIERLLEWCASETVRVSGGQAHGTRHENALPAIYLLLQKKADALASSGSEKMYNFYFDPHLPEAKRLISLTHNIQHRYRQIRKVWPEHATLWEVLRTCDEMLEFRHVDPLAKLITKAEKLHGYMYEWQRVASREFSTANLFDDLTKLLVSWRQLELTTWARLFDIEMEKCKDDAKSWFFVAFETLIAATDSIEDEKEIKIHAQQLLKTLEGFFYATTLGQYEERIALLQQLQRHIVMRTQDVQGFKHVALALDNFISYFSRLQKPVHDVLVRGRNALEKEINNVIKLASWKDTNIEALKQSAKTSHRKLSKLVRKFRKILNQPVSSIVKSGFPDEDVVIGEPQMQDVQVKISSVALELCTTMIPTWTERPTRFKNLSATISMMRRLSIPSDKAINGAAYIESLIADLERSIAKLQKATPNVLTEENKEKVQHLKTQKRKLYADTMKELRQMGVKMNLSSDVLARQDELSTVLAVLPQISNVGTRYCKGSEYFLHKALSIMAQVRDMVKEHSGDLTANDISKSIGLLEGLLNVAIRQRSILSRAGAMLLEMQVPLTQMTALCKLNEQTILRVEDAKIESARSTRTILAWLSAMLSTASQIVAAQAKLGKTDEIDGLINALREWSQRFRKSADTFEALPILPRNLWSEAHITLEVSIKSNVKEFHAAYISWFHLYPISRTLLKHLEPFILTMTEHHQGNTPLDMNIAIESQSEEIFAALDMILGSLQDVEDAIANLPSSTDDVAWLAKEEQALYVAATAFHSAQIKDAFSSVLHRMQYLHGQDHLRALVAMFCCVQPIFDQYIASQQYVVERFGALHCSTTKLLHRLCKTFIQIGTQGFCQPSEKSTDQQGKDDKLESGTGLGDGEGAEDISKDIEDDEDLEELAQDNGAEREGSIEEQDDAVDMGEQEMEGETGEVADKEDQDNDGEEGDEDMQSEVGSVDDLGPSAVDEKMWDDGGKDEDAKEKEGKDDVGTENQGEQVAAEQKESNPEDGKKEEMEKDGAQEEETEMEGEDQDENVGVGETEMMDPHAKEEETLDLPDELNIDGDDDDKEDDHDDMDMDDELCETEPDAEEPTEPDTIDQEVGPEQDEEQKDNAGHAEDEDMEQQDEEGDEPMDDESVPLPDQIAPEDKHSGDPKDNMDPSVEAGAGADANEEAHQDVKEQATASAANREDGNEGEAAEKTRETTTEDGTLGQTAQPDAGGCGEQEHSTDMQNFKKLGDVLEKWYDQQKQISEAREKDQAQFQQLDKELDMAKADFEHLENEEEQADTQALGTATEDQATALDHDMAMAVDEDEKMPARPEDNEEEVPQDGQQDVDMEDVEQGREQEQVMTDGRPQAFIGDQKPFSHDDDNDMQDAMPIDEEVPSETSSIAEVDTQLELTHITPSLVPTAESARDLWLAHESTTHSLSQQLTESLRLILAPTLATKLRGDFRTGKRLNLKRIIPYIASGYKRDKIWLRRSMPSKRNYQVLIALDDSRSMRESGSIGMGLKTLTLITRSLSMLEVGEVGVVGFGEHINVAHEFDKPFTSEAGVRIFEQFGFEASRTNVRGLVERSLELFGEARRKRSSSVGEDLWQLMLIVSDGICDSHAEIQRLVRRAQEERVMIVFVIIDSSVAPDENDAKVAVGTSVWEKEREKTSILDLQSVEISKEGKVLRWKYMERFPFRYYLVVRDVRELPGVLAAALRQWFGEVAGSV